jgi:hypothetical protein
MWLSRDTRALFNMGMELTWERHAAAMEQLQQHVNEPDVLRQLLQTVVLRRQSEASALLCRMSAIHHLSVEDAKGLLAAALPLSAGEISNQPTMNLLSELLAVLCK